MFFSFEVHTMPFLTQDPFLKISHFLFPRVKLVRKLYSWISDKLVYILRYTYLLYTPPLPFLKNRGNRTFWKLIKLIFINYTFSHIKFLSTYNKISRLYAQFVFTDSCVKMFRLRTKAGAWINLQSRGFLEMNKETGNIDHFLCINTLLR